MNVKSEWKHKLFFQFWIAGQVVPGLLCTCYILLDVPLLLHAIVENLCSCWGMTDAVDVLSTMCLHKKLPEQTVVSQSAVPQISLQLVISAVHHRLIHDWIEMESLLRFKPGGEYSAYFPLILCIKKEKICYQNFPSICWSWIKVSNWRAQASRNFLGIDPVSEHRHNTFSGLQRALDK